MLSLQVLFHLNPGIELISTFEGGSLYRAGKFNVVVLNGTYREMGGTTFTNGAHSNTNYQFVAVPENRDVWLKAPGFEDWVAVDLGKLFN